MKPLRFKDQNEVIARNQPEYRPLPAHITQDRMVISCWGLSLGERLRVLFTGRIWVSVLTFGAKLQPQKLTVFNPLDLARKLRTLPLRPSKKRLSILESARRGIET